MIELVAWVIVIVLVLAHIVLSLPAADPKCKDPACGGLMKIVLPSEIVASGVRSGVARSQVVREIAVFCASTGVKVFYACRKCGKMDGLKF